VLGDHAVGFNQPPWRRAEKLELAGACGPSRRREVPGRPDAGDAKAPKTLDTYADLFDADLDEVADRLNAAIQTTADGLRTASKAWR